jgi:hypothetical protein
VEVVGGRFGKLKRVAAGGALHNPREVAVSPPRRQRRAPLDSPCIACTAR